MAECHVSFLPAAQSSGSATQDVTPPTVEGRTTLRANDPDQSRAKCLVAGAIDNSNTIQKRSSGWRISERTDRIGDVIAGPLQITCT